MKKSFRDIDKDPALLVAKGKFDGSDTERKVAEKKHVKKLALAIFMSMVNNGYAKIRAVGPYANHNAVKALTIATGYCAPKGIELCWVSSFDEGNLGELRQADHVQSVNATVYTVKDWKDWSDFNLSNISTEILEQELKRRKSSSIDTNKEAEHV